MISTSCRGVFREGFCACLFGVRKKNFGVFVTRKRKPLRKLAVRKCGPGEAIPPGYGS